jgi:hypothetical protein
MPSRLAFLILIALVPLHAPAEEKPLPPAGTLCIAAAGDDLVEKGSCRAAAAESSEVDAADVPRLWTWIGKEVPVALAGTLAAGETRIALAIDEKDPAIRLRLDGSKERGWPTEVIIRAGNGADDWALRLPARETPWRIVVPSGKWSLTAEAPRHLDAARSAVVLERDETEVALRLDPVPAVYLRVVDGKGAPLPGAAVTDPLGERLAVANPLGEIEWESSDVLPVELFVSAEPVATRSLRVTDRRSDFRLDPVVMTAGSNLRITLERKDAPGTVDASLVWNHRAHYSRDQVGRVVWEGTFGGGDTIEAPRLQPGVYALFLEGEGTLARYSEKIEIADETLVEKTIVLDPYELTGEVFFGGQPVAGAEVTIGPPTAPGPQWKATVKADHGGRFDGMMWQRGGIVAAVRHDDPKISLVEFFKLGGEGGTEHIRIDVENFAIRGRVVDESGKPIANVSIDNAWKGGTQGGIQSARSDGGGRFEFPALKAGFHVVSVALPEFLPWERELTVSRETPLHDIEVVVERGNLLHFAVRTAEGRPVANAIVLETVRELPGGGRAPNRWQTDARGRVEIPSGRSGLRRLWVIDPAGTFAFTDVDASRATTAEAPHVISLPPPVGALVIRTVDDEGKPFPGSWLAIRWNGRAVPQSVLQAIGFSRSLQFRTGSDAVLRVPAAPSGQYEIWGSALQAEHVWMEVPATEPHASTYFTGGVGEILVTVPPRKER